MKEINELIKSLQWPCVTSITYPDGRMVLLDITFEKNNQYEIKSSTDSSLHSFLQETPEDLSSFDIFSTITHQQFTISVGDGSYEGEGIIYVINNEKAELHWFAFFENGGPFKNVRVDLTGYIFATAGNGVIWKMSIDNPIPIELIYKK